MADQTPPFRSAPKIRFQPVKYRENKLTYETPEKSEPPNPPEKQPQQQMATRWYNQTAVWAVIVSVMALIFSQLPPIGAWIPKDDLKAEIGNSVGCPLIIGIPTYQIFVDLKNTGNRSLAISNFELEITYPNRTIKHLEAQSYLKTLSGLPEPQNFPMTSVKLNTGEGWAEMIMFYATNSPSEEEEISRCRSQIAQSILAKKQTVPGQYNPNSLDQADENVVAEAVKFFEHKFDLEKGVYKASLTCTANGRKVTLKEFEFTLYDHHIKTFKSQPEDYKFGWGVYTSALPHKQVWASLSKGG